MGAYVMDDYRRALLGDHDCFTDKCQEAHRMALSALRPVSREQVEKVLERCQHSRVCGTCKVCVSGRYQQANFCAVCGAPLTDEAVETVVERINEITEEMKYEH